MPPPPRPVVTVTPPAANPDSATTPMSDVFRYGDLSIHAASRRFKFVNGNAQFQFASRPMEFVELRQLPGYNLPCFLYPMTGEIVSCVGVALWLGGLG